MEALAEACGVGAPTLRDIAGELLKPGRDPRDELPRPGPRSFRGKDVPVMKQALSLYSNHGNCQGLFPKIF